MPHKYSYGQKSSDPFNRGEMAFDKLQRVYMIDVLEKLGIDGIYLKIIKPIHHRLDKIGMPTLSIHNSV